MPLLADKWRQQGLQHGFDLRRRRRDRYSPKNCSYGIGVLSIPQVDPYKCKLEQWNRPTSTAER